MGQQVFERDVESDGHSLDGQNGRPDAPALDVSHGGLRSVEVLRELHLRPTALLSEPANGVPEGAMGRPMGMINSHRRHQYLPASPLDPRGTIQRLFYA